MTFKIGIQVYKPGGRKHLDALAEFAAAVQVLLQLQAPEPTEPIGPMPKGHVETQTDAANLIVTPFGTVPQAVSEAIRAGWPRNLWTDAGRVAYLEADKWNPRAERNTLSQGGGRCGVHIGFIRGVPIVSEDSVGLFQVNVCAWPYTREQMLDPAQNARAGYEIYRQQGWRAWQFTADTLGLL